MREINEDRVIREDECRKLTGVCRTTRYELEKKDAFRHVLIWVVVLLVGCCPRLWNGLKAGIALIQVRQRKGGVYGT